MTSIDRHSVLLAAAGVFAWTSLSLVAVRAPTSEAAILPIDLTFTGSLSVTDRGRIVERTFAVPPGTTQIDIDFSHDGAAPAEIDLGVSAPSGPRGWSEDRLDHIHIDRQSASYGYLPGPIEPGPWTLQIGVAHIPDGAVRYRAAIRLSGQADEPRVVLRSGAGWYAGDLHTHSGHSDGYHVTAQGERVPVAVRDIASAAHGAGLDFVAITDHNTASQWLDVDRTQATDGRVLLLHGSEMTTYEGHFNTIGARQLTDHRLGPRRSMRSLLADAATDHAFLSINHPLAAVDDEWCGGCHWANRDDETLDRVEGIEIVNGATSESDAPAWRWWTDLLNQGHRLVAVGGSDSHDLATAGHQVGEPTTVVFAAALSEDAIVAGLKSGRVYVRTAGARGPSIDLHGTSGGCRAVMGESLPAGQVRLFADVSDARGLELVWIKRGDEIQVTRIPADRAELSLDTDASPADWFSIVIRSPQRPVVFTNAIYIDRAGRSVAVTRSGYPSARGAACGTRGSPLPSGW